MVYFYVLITQSFSVEDNSSWCYDILVTFFSLVFDHIKYYTLHEQITFFNFFIQQSPHRKLSLYKFHRVIKSTIGEIHSHYLNVSSVKDSVEVSTFIYSCADPEHFSRESKEVRGISIYELGGGRAEAYFG